MTESSEICENLGFRWLVAIVTGWASLADKKSVTVATKIKPRFSHISLHFPHLVAEKGTKILPKADIIIASKISAGPYGSSVSSFPPSWYY
jgi:hypothetical protein